MGLRRPLSADERALLESLLSEAGPRVYGYVRKAFGAGVDVEDMVAETFARAADNVESLKACTRPELYLLTIARNLCRDAFRRKSPDLASNEMLEVRRPIASDAGSKLDQSEDRRRMMEAIERLPEAQREIVVLRLTAELKFEEIAEMLAIPLGTALSRMNSALARLRKELGCSHAR